MSHASEINASVLDALTEYGRSVILTQVVEGTYNAATGLYSGGSTNDLTVKALLLSYRDRDVDGSKIMADDRRCILAASGMTVIPKTGDLITPSGDTDDPSSGTYSVIRVKTYEVQGTPFAYVLQIRNVG